MRQPSQIRRCREVSGVYMRNRNLSSFEYFNTAVAIRNDVTRLVTSRDVPKSYRFIFAVPMAETARSVVFNLVKADAFYPNTARNVDERKRYMTLALADLNQLYQDMQSLLTMGLPIKAARLEGILDRIDSDIKLIKGARAGVKLIGKG
jgi:hypothetical protein